MYRKDICAIIHKSCLYVYIIKTENSENIAFVKILLYNLFY